MPTSVAFPWKIHPYYFHTRNHEKVRMKFASRLSAFPKVGRLLRFFFQHTRSANSTPHCYIIRVMTQTKICSVDFGGCGLEKDIDQFVEIPDDPLFPDGHSHACSECVEALNEKSKERRRDLVRLQRQRLHGKEPDLTRQESLRRMRNLRAAEWRTTHREENRTYHNISVVKANPFPNLVGKTTGRQRQLLRNWRTKLSRLPAQVPVPPSLRDCYNRRRDHQGINSYEVERLRAYDAKQEEFAAMVAQVTAYCTDQQLRLDIGLEIQSPEDWIWKWEQDKEKAVPED